MVRAESVEKWMKPPEDKASREGRNGIHRSRRLPGFEAPIRVCHVNTRFLRGGGPRNTLLTIANLPPQKYRITLVVGNEVNWKQLDEHPHLEVLQIPSMVRAVRPLQDLRTLWRLYRLFTQRRFHVVHTHFAKAGVLGRIAAGMAGVPVVIHSIHGSTFPPTIHPIARAVYRKMERFAGRFTHLFIPVAEGLKKEYLDAGVGRPDLYRVVHSGFDLDTFRGAADIPRQERNRIRRDLGIEEQDFAMVYVANLEPRKGHGYALEMMRRLVDRHPHLLLLLAGEGSHRASLESLIREASLEKHVRLIGYRSDIHRVLSAVDLKIFTSLWEGLPQALVQAAATGLPIVAFDVDCVGEVVRDGKNGFLVPVGDVETLARRVETLIEDPFLRKNMAASGRSVVDDSWDVKAMVQGTEDAYSSMLQAVRIPPGNRRSAFGFKGVVS